MIRTQVSFSQGNYDPNNRDVGYEAGKTNRDGASTGSDYRPMRRREQVACQPDIWRNPCRPCVICICGNKQTLYTITAQYDSEKVTKSLSPNTNLRREQWLVRACSCCRWVFRLVNRACKLRPRCSVSASSTQ